VVAHRVFHHPNLEFCHDCFRPDILLSKNFYESQCKYYCAQYEGKIFNNLAGTGYQQESGQSYTNGDVLRITLDMQRGQITFKKVGSSGATTVTQWVGEQEKLCTVRVFRQKFTLEDAIGSHACSLEANTPLTG
jgi:hypothetical protein